MALEKQVVFSIIPATRPRVSADTAGAVSLQIHNSCRSDVGTFPVSGFLGGFGSFLLLFPERMWYNVFDHENGGLYKWLILHTVSALRWVDSIKAM